MFRARLGAYPGVTAVLKMWNGSLKDLYHTPEADAPGEAACAGGWQR